MTCLIRFTAKDVIVLGWDDLHTLTFFLPLATVNLCGFTGSSEGDLLSADSRGYAVLTACSDLADQ